MTLRGVHRALVWLSVLAVVMGVLYGQALVTWLNATLL